MTRATDDDRRPLDQAHERAGYALIAVGCAVLLAATGCAIALITGYALGPAVEPAPYVWIAALGAGLAAFGTLILVGVQRLAGARITAPGGSSLEVEATVTATVTAEDEGEA